MKKIFRSLFLLTIICSSACIAQNTRLLATYYGNTGNENGLTVATDTFGNVYMAGITGSLGMASGGFQNTFGGGIVDAYLVKFNSAGERLWATYYGGPGEEMAFFGGKIGIATDASGNVFLGGLTNSTSGIASTGAYDETIGGVVDAYLVKFDSTGDRMWATYYGGSDVDYGYDVATDKSGNVYLTGMTGSTSDIASGGFQNTIGGSSDAYLVKFDGNGNRIWATYYGGTATDEGCSITTDASANVYLTGCTSSNSGIASGGFQNSFGGGTFDAFLVKFDSSGARKWATYYGGAGEEYMLFAGDLDVATDNSENVFLTGLTTSSGSIASGGYQNTFGGGSADGFLVKFDSAGTRLWATYYGGSDEDKFYSVATDTAENVYVVGHTLSSSGISSGGFQDTYATNEDGFLVKFTSDGIRSCATYYGGNDFDSGEGLGIDPEGNVYLSGNTATLSGMAYNGFQNSFGGGASDAYLVKFTACDVATQVEEITTDQSFSIYPNPTSQNFAVKYFSGKNGVITIDFLNASGQIIFREEKQVKTGLNFLSFEKNDCNGMCLLRIISEENILIRKIVFTD